MANPEHLAKLREGVAVWNAWRAENPDVRPDLNKANLTGAHLTGADDQCQLNFLPTTIIFPGFHSMLSAHG